jgi:hypothetical protein
MVRMIKMTTSKFWGGDVKVVALSEGRHLGCVQKLRAGKAS